MATDTLDTAARREFAEQHKRREAVRKAIRWGDLGRTLGTTPEAGQRAISITDRLYGEMTKAGYEPRTFNDEETDRLWNNVVGQLPGMVAIKDELQAFSEEHPAHKALVSNALYSSLGGHPASQFFNPSTESQEKTWEMVEGAERAMRLAGRGVALDDPAISNWIGEDSGKVRAGLSALGLSEQHQTAAMLLGRDASFPAFEVHQNAVEDLGRFAALGEPQRTAASYMLNYAEQQLESGREASHRPDWATSFSETMERIAEAVKKAPDVAENSIHPDLSREVEAARSGDLAAPQEQSGRAPGLRELFPQVDTLMPDAAPGQTHRYALVVNFPGGHEAPLTWGTDDRARAEEAFKLLEGHAYRLDLAPLWVEDTQEKTTLQTSWSRPEAAPEAGQNADVERPAGEPQQAGTAGRPAEEQQQAQTAAKRVSVQMGDVPDSLRKRYLLEADSVRGDIAFHKDASSTTPVFRDTGAKLTTRETNAQTIHDMVETAKHRGWDQIKVTGTEDFRRAVWLEARVNGLEVSGYKPNERDRLELDKILDARDGQSIEPTRIRTADREQTDQGRSDQAGASAPTPEAKPKDERPDYDKGVSGVLKEIGSAPYQHQKGNEESPFIRLETSPGKETTIWGVGLPAALERSGVQVGDEVTARRDGKELVEIMVKSTDKSTGQTIQEPRSVERAKWEVTADRFRDASPAEAAHDPKLRDAQSNLKVLETAINAQVKDPALREKLMKTAKEHIAESLGQGRTFKEARVRDTKERASTTQRAASATRQAVAKATSQTANKAPSKAPGKRPEGKTKKGPERSRGR